MGVSNHLPCNIEDVVDLLSIPVVRSSGTQLHCRCPFCDDRKAHLNINLSKNVFRCNRCGTGGGVLHLYAEVNNISINTAYEELCRIFQSGEKAPEHPVRKAQTKVKQSIPKRWSSNYKGIDDLLLSFIERRRITDSIFGRL